MSLFDIEHEFDYDDDYQDFLADARVDAAWEEFEHWCHDNDIDSDDPDAWDEYRDATAFQAGIYYYNGIDPSDFI